MNITFLSISKKYRSTYAFRDFSASLSNGVYGFLGANGAGKTTLINILVGILGWDGGHILINGTNAKKMGSKFLSQIGYLPQYPRFYKSFEVYDFLLYMGCLKDMPRDKARKRASELLEFVNLSNAAKKRIGALSGGMRQRMGIAAAMMNDPKVLILDEPTAGLDPQERIRFRNLITKFSENRIVLLATHIVSDRVLLLKQGHLIKHDTPDSLMREIDGKVWLVSVDDNNVNEKAASMKISNMFREGDTVLLRVINDNKPDEHAVTTAPNLEDVFLYYNGEDEIW